MKLNFNDMQTIKKLFKNITSDKQSINLKQVLNKQIDIAFCTKNNIK